MTTEIPIISSARAKGYFADKVAFTTGPVEVNHKIENGDDPAIIDVREAEDFAKGHVPGAVNLPEAEWDSVDGLRREEVNIIYCYTQTCHLGARAAGHFHEPRYQAMEMDGGFP